MTGSMLRNLGNILVARVNMVGLRGFAGVSGVTKIMGVTGAGQMGSGIAQVGAMAGLDVVLHDQSPEALGRGMQRMEDSLSRIAKKGAISKAEIEAVLGRVRCTSSLADFSAADFVVEAVTEDKGVKEALFRDLDAATPAHAVLASNTSSIPITWLASRTRRPNKVIGMHFMNPPPIMQLVEIVRGLPTDDETFQVTRQLAERFGKTVCVSRDHPGFVVNRLLMPMINEAFFALQECIASPEDIDTAMKLGTNQPMGPLTLADFIGLDTCLAIMRVLQEGIGEDKYRPCPLLVQYVDAKWLGKKVGRGVFSYETVRDTSKRDQVAGA